MSIIEKKLQLLAGKTDNKLTKYVVNILLDAGNSEEIESYIEDILNLGCVSGTVSELIYYKDTHEFFDKFYNEIEQLRFDYEQETGEQLKIENDLKNFLAWFGFEKTLQNITIELEKF